MLVLTRIGTISFAGAVGFIASTIVILAPGGLSFMCFSIFTIGITALGDFAGGLLRIGASHNSDSQDRDNDDGNHANDDRRGAVLFRG
jgi:hypothetical protein